MGFLFGTKKPNAPWSKYYSGDMMNLNIPDESVFSYFEKKVLGYGNRNCMDYYGNKIKYDELLSKIDLCAKGLYDAGVRKGDVVTVCLPNTLEGIISFFAINKIGGVVNFIHPASSENEIKNSLNETNSRVLILIDTNYIKVKNIEKDIKVCRVILVSVYGYMPFAISIRRPFEERVKLDLSKNNSMYIFWNFFLIKAKKIHVENYIADSDKERDAIILYSGGTTGTPKGVVLTNGNLIAFVESAIVGQSYLVENDTCLALMPIFHGFGIVHSILYPLCIGMNVILRPKFDVKEYCKMIIKYKPQILMGVPSLFESLLVEWKNPNIKLDFLRYILVAGDVLNDDLRNRINRFLKKHGADIKVSTGYGLSEAVCGVSLGDPKETRDDAIGIPLPGIYVGIFDSNNKEVPYGEIGEICVCGPTVMRGYYNNQEETDLVLKVHKDGNTWLHTGDAGSMDEDGFIKYSSRIKRMIISSGYNVYPNMIEKLIESHPSVAKCTVVGIPHKRKMEVPKAYVILKKNKSRKELLIMDFKNLCKKNLPKYSWPFEYAIVDELPKTKVGKVDFKKLQEGTKEE